MDSYIQITKLNDFGFCPHSIYLHAIYEGFEDSTYKDVPQNRGKIHHESIDKSKYTTSTNMLQGLSVYSSKYGIAGKIDLYDKKTKTLIDRKYLVTQIHQGYKLQLYAQMICMQEMGYEIKSIKLHSLSDNKRYRIPLPNQTEIDQFESIVNQIHQYDPLVGPENQIASKCGNCIYNGLCAYAQLT